MNSLMLQRLALIMALTAVLAAQHGCAPSEPIVLFSPDGRTEVHIATHPPNGGTQLSYGILRDGAVLVGPAPLSLTLSNGVTWGDNLNITNAAPSSGDDTWTSRLNKCSEIRNQYNAVTITLRDPEGLTFDLIFRAYDDGVAFRYHFEAQAGLENLELVSEQSTFVFSSDCKYWGLHLNSYTSNYETDYTASTLSQIPAGDILGLPLLIQASEKSWVALTEADLTNYAGMYVTTQTAGATALVSSLAPRRDGSGLCVKAPLPHDSPWRVIMIGDNPGTLIESNLILNLNDPAAIDDSWIKPGKSAWDWWNGPVLKNVKFQVGMNTATFQKFIDFCQESGLEYMLIDAGWYGGHRDADADVTQSIPEMDMPGLVQYGKERGVDILIWLNWEPLDKQLEQALATYKGWGVKGIKVDYMDSDDQETVNFYHRLVERAAEYQLMVDFHGAYKPTGWQRTYPNLITREGVMGLEYLKWSARANPEHNTTVPFTRMLAGPLDYTPGGFLNVSPDKFKPRNLEPMTLTTRCHQTALFVIFESPLQVLADHPDAYRNTTAFEFIKQVPTVWDETRFINGEVGEYITLARRQGNTWYLGSITDGNARRLEIPLDFLGSGAWQADIYSDGPDAGVQPQSVSLLTQQVTSNDRLTAQLGAGGGYAVRFVKTN